MTDRWHSRRVTFNPQFCFPNLDMSLPARHYDGREARVRHTDSVGITASTRQARKHFVVSISFEARSKRRFHRVNVPLTVQIQGVAYAAQDWSIGGFRVDNYRGPEQVGAEFKATLLLPYTEFAVQLPVQTRIIRREGDAIGCTFVNLTAPQNSALHHLVEAAIEGRIGDMGEVLESLHTPVGKAETKLVEESEGAPVPPEHRFSFHKLLYLLASGGALLAVAGLVYYLLHMVRIPDGIIMGNVVRVAPANPGRLSKLHVVVGDRVKAGQPLFEVTNATLIAGLQTAQGRLNAALAEQKALEESVQSEQAYMDFYGKVTTQQITMKQAQLSQSDAQLRLATNNLERISALRKQGIADQVAYETVVRDVESLTAQRQQYEAELNLLKLNDQASEQGLFFDGRQIRGQVRVLKAKLTASESLVAEAREQVTNAIARLTEMVTCAPNDGTVYAIMRQPGESTEGMAPVALDLGQREYAAGTLTADEATKVIPGMPVQIAVPTLKLRLSGIVASIGRQVPAGNVQQAFYTEVDANRIPILVKLNEPRPELPAGVRAVLIIRVNPWAKLWSY